MSAWTLSPVESTLAALLTHIFEWLVKWSYTGGDFLSNMLTIGVFHPEYGSKKQQTHGLLSLRVLLQVTAQRNLLALFLHKVFPRVSVLMFCK